MIPTNNTRFGRQINAILGFVALKMSDQKQSSLNAGTTVYNNYLSFDVYFKHILYLRDNWASCVLLYLAIFQRSSMQNTIKEVALYFYKKWDILIYQRENLVKGFGAPDVYERTVWVGTKALKQLWMSWRNL